jgi:2'-5' RNA ligase
VPGFNLQRQSAWNKAKTMHYALVFYPQLETDRIDAIRRKYDPTVDVIKPHVTVVFPVPETVGEAALIGHIERVLSAWSPFEIRLGGFWKSPDHWLFLTLAEGEPAVKELYQAIYTGILAAYRRDDIEFVPHLGLGLFLKESTPYDWDNPQETDFDQPKYEAALREARALPLGSSCTIDTLHVVKIPDEILDWATGKSPTIPRGLKIVDVRAVTVGADGERPVRNGRR